MLVKQYGIAKRWLVAFALLVCWLSTACRADSAEPTDQPPTQDNQNKVDEKTIRALIAELGDESFVKRDAAFKRLAAIGEASLPFLQKAAKESTDAEVRERAEQLIARLSEYQSAAAWFPDGLVFDVAFSKDGRTMAVACGDKVIRIYDWKTRQIRHTLRGHDARVWAIAFAPDGKKLASCAGEYRTPLNPGEVKIWDLATGKEDASFKGHQGLASG